jgi:Zn-dependent alcohol dehydrogenase
MGSSNARRDIPRFLDMWRSGQLDLTSMITARRPLDDINLGMADMVAGAGVRTVIEL